MRTVFMIGVVLCGGLSLEGGQKTRRKKSGKNESKTNLYTVYRKLKKKSKSGSLTENGSSKYEELKRQLALNSTVKVSPQPDRYDESYDENDEFESIMREMEQNSRE